MLVAGEHAGAPVVQALEQFSRMQSEREQTLGFAAMTLKSTCRLCRVSTFATLLYKHRRSGPSTRT